MPNNNTDALFQLIKTMTKAEKRYFTLYTGKQNQKADAKFMKLFNTLDKMDKYSDKEILLKIRDVKPTQLANLKAHLYKELLTCLRLLYSNRDYYTQIREQIDYARLLYNRGLHLQSLKILERAKTLAQDNSHFILTLEILQFEKAIESHYITRSLQGRAEYLEKHTNQTLTTINDVTLLSNLALRMYGLFLEIGFVKNDTDKLKVQLFFKNTLKNTKETEISVFGQLYYHQAHCWYYYIQQNFVYYYRHAQQWVDIFHKNRNFASYDLIMYLKANHNLLNSLFILGKYDTFCKSLADFEHYIHKKDENINLNIQIQIFIYIYTAKINKHFLEGTFSEGLALIPEIEHKLEYFGDFIDTHRVMIFYYKIACLYFGSGQYSKALIYLNMIINLKVGHLRSDIQCFARILHLTCHFELKNTDIMEYLIKSIYKFLLKMEYLDDIQKEILSFLKKTVDIHPKDIRQAFIDLRDQLHGLAQTPYNRRSYLYLDIVSWLESNIYQKPVQQIIQEKFAKKQHS